MQQAVQELVPQIGVAAACRALGVPRSSYYRGMPKAQATSTALDTAASDLLAAAAPRPRGRARGLSADEQAQVLSVLNSERFADLAPREVYATLLDERRYLCSWSTMYRLLRQARATTRRRDRPRRTGYTKPELLATGPRQLWSWDITKLKGPTTWTYFYLYVILDVFSRYVVGWMITNCESAELAEALIAETCAHEAIRPDQLTIHADRGSAMTSKCVAELLSDLGVAKTHSRPHVSNDNPFSEAQFKTVKYHPTCPERFGCLEDARAWARPLFAWYNHEHHHTGLGLLTPAVVHHGQAETVLAARHDVLSMAYQSHPERFVRGQPRPATPPTAVWINPPAERTVPSQALFAPPAGLTSRAEPAPVAASRGEQPQRPLDAATGGGYAQAVNSVAAVKRRHAP
jgi:putative transposase